MTASDVPPESAARANAGSRQIEKCERREPHARKKVATRVGERPQYKSKITSVHNSAGVWCPILRCCLSASAVPVLGIDRTQGARVRALRGRRTRRFSGHVTLLLMHLTSVRGARHIYKAYLRRSPCLRALQHFLQSKLIDSIFEYE